MVDEEVEERRGRERLGAEHTGAGPRSAGQQLEGDHRVDGGLPDDRLAAVAGHRLLVVGEVVQVHLPRVPVLAGAGDPRAGARAAAHPVAEGGGVGEAGGDDVARRHLVAAHRHLVGAVEADLVEHLEHLDELVTEAVLEGDPVGSRPTAG